jgi:predicted N-acyltransferase
MKEIEREDWNSLAGKDKAETTYEWFSFIEQADLNQDINYCHAVYREKQGKPKGILPAFYQNICLRDYVYALGFFSLGRVIPNMKTPVKVTGAYIPFSTDSRYFGDKNHFHDCLNEIEKFSRDKNCFFIVMRNLNEKLDLPDYSSMELFPEVYTEPYLSWDEYIQSQRSKRGKHMRYEYKKSVENGTETYIEQDLRGYSDVLYTLHMNVSRRNKGEIIVYPRNYFKKMEDHIPQFTKCIFAENKGDIIGYLFLLENDHFITCKYAGRDYSAADPYVYFRLLYELIKYSIKKKKPISMEKASYEAKLRRGFKYIEKWCYLKPLLPVVGDVYINMVTKRNKRIGKRIQEVKSFQ